MYILGLDTASPYLSMAVSKGERVLSERNCKKFRAHSSHIVITFTELLAKCRIKANGIDLFAVSTGPGSFTGLRIGAAFIKGLAFNSKKPIVSVPTLDVLAAMCKGKEEFVCPIVDAKRQNVYCAVYKAQSTENRVQRTEKKIKRLTKYYVIPVREIIERLKTVSKKNHKIIFTGDGLKLYRKDLENAFGKRCVFTNESRWLPRASVVARLGLELYNKGKVTPLDKLKPMYLYPRDVQCQKR